MVACKATRTRRHSRTLNPIFHEMKNNFSSLSMICLARMHAEGIAEGLGYVGGAGGRGCTPEFPATKSKKLVKVPRTQEKKEKNYERTHLTPPPQIADFPSQRIEPNLKGRSILRDKSVAYSQLWRRSGTLAWPARTTSPKAARNLRSAIKIDLRTQFHRVFFIATTRQSTSSLINMDIGPFDPPPPLP